MQALLGNDWFEPDGTQVDPGVVPEGRRIFSL